MVDVDDYRMQMTNSSIHNLNYANKVLWTLLMLLFVIVSSSSMDLFMINLLLLVILTWSNVSFKAIFSNISFFGVFLFLLFFIISLVFLDLYLGFYWLLKIVDVIVLLSLVGMTTSFYDLVKGTRRLLKPFSFLGNINELSLTIGCFLKFLSIIYSERKRIDDVKSIRGVVFEKMGLVDRIDFVLKEMVLVFSFSFKKLDKFKKIAYKNKYGVDSLKYNYRLNKWTKTDTILLVMGIFMIFVVFVY